MACCIETAELARVRTMCLTKRTLRMNMTKKRKKNYLTDYLYILPAAAFVGIFFVSSILYTFLDVGFDILNLNAKISKEPLPGGSFFDCKKVCRETDEKICRILETSANLHCSL